MLYRVASCPAGLSPRQNSGSRLGQRRRRWPSLETAFGRVPQQAPHKGLVERQQRKVARTIHALRLLLYRRQSRNQVQRQPAGALLGEFIGIRVQAVGVVCTRRDILNCALSNILCLYI